MARVNNKNRLQTKHIGVKTLYYVYLSFNGKIKKTIITFTTQLTSMVQK